MIGMLSMKMSKGLCLFVCFCLSLFETTEICLGSTKMDNFYREKANFTPRLYSSGKYTYATDMTVNSKEKKSDYFEAIIV